MDTRPRPTPATECRCLCGNLVARVVKGGVELKCRRCKRMLLVPWGGGALQPVPADSAATLRSAPRARVPEGGPC